jgi:hypothetical protein
MADVKISALPASSTPLAGTEILPIVQSSTTRQVSVANLTAGRAVSALSLTSTNDATINGITVGRGGGNVNLNTAVGLNALAATSTGDGNAAFGASALASNLAGLGNTATGFTSLRDNTSGNYNVASGYLALGTNLSGSNNVGIGFSVLSTATATSNNTAIGYEALKVASGGTNTAIGYQSGIAMTSGTNNVILGSYSGNNATLDIRGTNYNLVLSDGAGNVRAWWDNANARFYGTLLATGITNSALTSGRVTYAGTSGVLQDSANLLYSGGDLTVYGINVGRGASAVATNTVLGASALAANTSGVYNTAVGYEALKTNTDNSANTALGYRALSLQGAGVYQNTGVGAEALYTNLTGASNSAFGRSALFSNTSGNNNTGLGTYALFTNLTASNNTAVGFEAGYTNSTGAKNVFIGQKAGKVSTGSFNTIIGNEAGLALTTGTCNTFVGAYNNSVGGSGELVTSGSKNTILGVFTGNQGGLDIRTASNYIVLSDGDGNPRGIFDSSGNFLVGATSQIAATAARVVIKFDNNNFYGLAIGGSAAGGAGLANFYNSAGTEQGYISTNGTGTTTYATSSDYRLKENIAPMTGALATVAKLKPVTYRWKESGLDGQGFIAHELAEVMPDCVSREKDAVDADGKPVYQGVDTSFLVATLTAAIQELKAEFDAYKTTHP